MKRQNKAIVVVICSAVALIGGAAARYAVTRATAQHKQLARNIKLVQMLTVASKDSPTPHFDGVETHYFGPNGELRTVRTNYRGTHTVDIVNRPGDGYYYAHYISGNMKKDPFVEYIVLPPEEVPNMRGIVRKEKLLGYDAYVQRIEQPEQDFYVEKWMIPGLAPIPAKIMFINKASGQPEFIAEPTEILLGKQPDDPDGTLFAVPKGLTSVSEWPRDDCEEQAGQGGTAPN